MCIRDSDSNMKEMHKKYEGKNGVFMCGIVQSMSNIIVKVIVHIFIPRYYMIYVNVCLRHAREKGRTNRSYNLGQNLKKIKRKNDFT